VANRGASALGVACAVLVGLSCARPPRSAVDPGSTRAARAGDSHSASTGNAAPAGASDAPPEPLPQITGAEGPEPSTPGGDQDPCNQQATVDGPQGIHVLVRWCTDTGQYHIAKELVITTPGGTLRFASQSSNGVPDEVHEEPMYPLMEQILAVGPTRWVLLGWTSYGEGLQTEHAWLIEDRQGPHVLDSLAWTTDRTHGGFAVESSRTPPIVRIGIPLPETPKHREFDPDQDEDGPPALHNAGDWELVHDQQQLALDDLRRLPSVEQHVMSLRGYYNPPYQEEPSRRHWSGRFIWFSAGAKFTLAPPARP
jgi:hypothetical protein